MSRNTPQVDSSRRGSRAAPAAPTDEMGRFVGGVLGRPSPWKEIFAEEARTYRAPRLVLFDGPDAIGLRWSRRRRWGRSIARPICEVYLDTSFFRQIETPLPRLRRRQWPASSHRLCDRARGRSSRAEPARHSAAVQQLQQQRPQQGGSQPHPGAGRTAGRLLRRRVGQPRGKKKPTCSSRATSMLRCRPPPRSATTRCRSARRAAWCRIASPTARRNSASAGSSSASAGQGGGLQHVRGDVATLSAAAEEGER